MFGKSLPTVPVTVRSHLKNRILAQGQGGIKFQAAGILGCFEELKREGNTGFEPGVSKLLLIFTLSWQIFLQLIFLCFASIRKNIGRTPFFYFF